MSKARRGYTSKAKKPIEEKTAKAKLECINPLTVVGALKRPRLKNIYKKAVT